MPDFGGLSFWHWWALALLLIAVEVFVPSTFLLGPAAAAFVVGTLMLIVPGISVGWLVLIYSVLAIALTFAVRAYVRRHPPATDKPLLNRRAAGLVGERVVLDEDLINGRGSIRLGDSRWRVRVTDGSTVLSGATVEVTDYDGAELIVSAV